MNVVGLQQIKKLWKNIMRKKQLGLGQKEIAGFVALDLADITNQIHALNVKKILL
jgi:hypothetical protein